MTMTMLKRRRNSIILITILLLCLCFAGLHLCLRRMFGDDGGTSYRSITLLQEEQQQQQNSVNVNDNVVPNNKIIWMYWDQGWNHPSTLKEAHLSRATWEVMNPDYTVMALDGSTIEEYTNRSQYVSDTIWNTMTIQGKSDVYRILLLYHYGGVWVDASVTSLYPLAHWLDSSTNDLFTFLRQDNIDQQQRLDIDPWVTSWFMASPRPKAPMISSIVNIIQTQAMERIIQRKEYFWLHRIISELARNNTSPHYNHGDGDGPTDAASSSSTSGLQLLTRLPSANPMHCRSSTMSVIPPMFKRYGHGVVSVLYKYFLHCGCNHHHYHHSNTASMEEGIRITKQQDNINNPSMDATTITSTICRDWDCSSLGANWNLIVPQYHEGCVSTPPPNFN